jgi:hypothetical protein
MPRLLALMLVLVALAATMVLPAHAAAATPMPTAAQIDAYLASKASPMAGQGAAFVASGGRWQLDPRLLVAIAGAESSFGKLTCARHNAWGWGCPNNPYQFDSWADGIDAVSKGLRTYYVAEGRTTVALINLKYAPLGAANDPTGLNNHWTTNVSRFLVEQGGDPNRIDLDGVAGTIPLGPLGGASLDSFGFQEADDRPGGDEPALEVAVGAPRTLTVRVRNTGYVAWRPRDVRLRRIDTEPRVVGAPYGALARDGAIEPGQEGEFIVQLAAVGSSEGRATTTWRLEGPSGPFGPELVRVVAFSVPPFVAGEGTAEVTAADAGVAGGSAWTVIVRVRNDGADTWTREGDEAVHLGLVDAAGSPFGREGWINERVAARMLERSAAPGESASFAFRVRGEGAALAMRPFRTSGWASGKPLVVRVGLVPRESLAQLDERLLRER